VRDAHPGIRWSLIGSSESCWKWQRGSVSGMGRVIGLAFLSVVPALRPTWRFPTVGILEDPVRSSISGRPSAVSM
jgi:hypothetical protein